MVSTDATLASQVGLEVLAAGGNAVDAAVATAFALAVVYPAAGNIGGGGFMVARIDGASHALDFRETAPSKVTRDVFLGADGKATKASREGHRASGVPGSVAGLYEAFMKLGSKKKTWAELIAPAIKLADLGFVVDDLFSKVLADMADRFKVFPASAALFLPGGTVPPVGATWRNPDLATVLKRIASLGPAGFYEGPTADLIAAEMGAHDGLITLADLSAYRAKWRTPLEFSYRGQRIVAMPPPSSGGVTLGMICRILESYDLSKLPWHSPKEIHLEVEAMRRAFAARNARLGDPDFVANPTELFLSDGWIQKQRASIKDETATPSSEIAGEGPSSGNGPHTTHFSVVDAKGNAVALTTTINWWFGSGVTVTGAGFLLNNEMDDFASVPGTANGFGLVQGEPNAIAPGKRMLSSMSPTIVLGEDGRVRLVLGAAGGPTIITAVFGILSNVVDHGFDVSAAVNAPRFHQQHMPDVVAYEKDGITPELRAGLEAMGYTLKERDHLADAPAIGRSPTGWIGAPEPRRGGAFAAGW
jgi:gamma-glutamyltranspeptidase / glutathione hydrolase